MAPCRRFITANQSPFAISLVPCPRNSPLYRSATTQTSHPIILGHEFWPEHYGRLGQIDGTLAFRQFSIRGWLPLLSINSPIDKSLVHEFYANSETIRDQSGFPYTASASPREEDIAKALRSDRSDVFRVVGARLSPDLLFNDYQFLNSVASYDLSPVSYTNTLTRSYFTHLYAIAIGVPIDSAYIIFSTIDGVASSRCTTVLPSADVTEGGKAVPGEDYLVDQMPPQFCPDPSPPHPVHPDPGASSSSAPPPAIHEHQDQFATSFSTLATDLHSLLSDDDDDDSDEGDFTPNTSTT
ncbi:hypothetical protein F0562_025336 [Nyssa sinensis]|uniref:Uncharacterized protein n=1 Tax=Nyssa sinensis TaxID=561372 RepID=A0A5J5BF60_9ASTE|nr:hypothetical protein F0562_025336 [Nyssa sinensis]